MYPVLKSLGQEIYSHATGHNVHKGFLVKWSLIGPLCKKWSRNRDPDQERVSEMIAHCNKGGYIPRLIHLADVAGEGLVCYDGNHRREVFNQIESEDNTCIIDVLFDASQADVYKAFNDINKAVQVPAIFLEEGTEVEKVKQEILDLVRSYESKYKAFVSTSARYHAPNFNRDAFTDNIYSLYKSFNGTKSVADIAALLEVLNQDYADGKRCRPHSAYKPVVIDKCKKGLWLFIDRVIPFEHLEQVTNDMDTAV